MSIISSIFSSGRKSAVASPDVQRLVRAMRYELIPLKSLDQAIADLPKGAPVSVTCSPAKGIATTQELTLKLQALGHDAVPHFAARLVESPEHAARLAEWVRTNGIREVFIIGGDAETPPHYQYALPFMRDFLEAKPGIDTLGFGAYPDGHATISHADLSSSIHEKQKLILEHGVKPLASTQMCFDGATIRSWLKAERARGFTTPINLGLPGVVDRAKLMSMGMRLGIGQSMRYLSKNKSTITRMFAPGGYDPTKLLADLAGDADDLGITGIHSFTFNSTADTAKWANAILED
jgi:methylenetetrahydrofolate reductase (NADPH)